MQEVRTLIPYIEASSIFSNDLMLTQKKATNWFVMHLISSNLQAENKKRTKGVVLKENMACTRSLERNPIQNRLFF